MHTEIKITNTLLGLLQ